MSFRLIKHSCSSGFQWNTNWALLSRHGLLLILISNSSVATARHQAEKPEQGIKNPIISEALSSWRNLDSSVLRMVVGLHEERGNAGPSNLEILDDKSKKVIDYSIYSDNRYGKIITTSGSMINLQAANPQYAFRLARGNQGTKAPWAITSINKDGLKVTGQYKEAPFSGFLFSRTSLGNTRLIELFESPDLRLINITESNSRVVVEFSSALVRGSYTRHVKGSVELDRDKDWVVVAYDFIAQTLGQSGSGHVTGSLEYKQTEGGDWFPTICVIDDVREVPQSHRRTVQRFKYEGRATIPESDFRLSGYGFPEPIEERQNPLVSKTWIILINVVILLIIVSVGVWLRRGHRAASGKQQ